MVSKIYPKVILWKRRMIATDVLGDGEGKYVGGGDCDDVSDSDDEGEGTGG